MADSYEYVIEKQFSEANGYPIRSYDETANEFSLGSIYFHNAALYPAQGNTFAGVVNAVPGRGANSPAVSANVAYAGGGMAFDNGVLGNRGLKIGVDATASVPHVNDCTHFAATQEYLVMVSHRHTATPNISNTEVLIGQGAAAAALGSGTRQFVLGVHGTSGLACEVAGSNVFSGIIPALNKSYLTAMHIVPDPAGQTRIGLYVYNLTDNQVVVDDLPLYAAYRAFAAMTTGGTCIGNPLGFNLLSTPKNCRIWSGSVERITGTDPRERFADRVAQHRRWIAAGVIS